MSVTCDRSTSALSFFIYLTVAETSEQADRQYREHVRRCRHPSSSRPACASLAIAASRGAGRSVAQTCREVLRGKPSRAAW